jgi:hypothetical protein
MEKMGEDLFSELPTIHQEERWRTGCQRNGDL